MSKLCKNCGTRSEENDIFCKNCGKKLADECQNVAVTEKTSRISVKSCKDTHSVICRIISILSVVELLVMLFVFGYMSTASMTQKTLLPLTQPLRSSILFEIFRGVIYRNGLGYWIGFCIYLTAIFSIIVFSGISGMLGKRNKQILYISASLNLFLLFVLPFMSSGAYFGISGVRFLLARGIKAGECCLMLALVLTTIVLQCVAYLDFAKVNKSKIRLILGILICTAILALPVYYFEDDGEFVRAMKYIGALCRSTADVNASYLATAVGIMPILIGVCFCSIPNVFREKGFAVMRSIIFGAVILIADFLILSDISYIICDIDDYSINLLAVALLNAIVVCHICLDFKSENVRK